MLKRLSGITVVAMPCIAALAFALPAAAADPYKDKNFVQKIVGDLGIEAPRIKSFRRSSCGAIASARYESTEANVNAPSNECMTVDLTDAYGVYIYDKDAKKWKQALLLTPATVKGFQVAETVSLGATLRELVFQFEARDYLIVSFYGGFIGDNKYPLEIARRLDEIGFSRLASARYISPQITGQTIYLYR